MRTLSIARRTLVTCGVVFASLVGASASPATPGNGDGSLQFRPGTSNQPFDIPAVICGFPIHVVPLRDVSKLLSDTTLPDGTEIQRGAGESVLSFTNVDTGKTYVLQTSGSGMSTVYPNGGYLLDLRGQGGFSVSPRGQANTGEPGLVFFSGHLVLSAPDRVVTSVTITGTQENGCELLS